MSIFYDYSEAVSLSQVNASADAGWRVISITKATGSGSFNVFFVNQMSIPVVETNLTNTFQQITATPDTTASFYLNKTISYGDIILYVFLTMFLVWSIIGALWKFVFPVNLKK